MKYFLDTEFHEYSKKTGLFKRTAIDTIELISIGIVSEDGREYYAISNEFDVDALYQTWVWEQVIYPMYLELRERLPHLLRRHFPDTITPKRFKKLLKWFGKSRQQIKNEIIEFVYPNEEYYWEYLKDSTSEFYISPSNWKTPSPEFYAYYADYDWVVFCWLFGRMIDLPYNFPMYCRDLKQMMDERGLGKSWKDKNYPDPVGEHNALVDARWNMGLYHKINNE